MTTAYRLDRRTALRAAAGFVLAGPLLVPLARRPRAQTLEKVSFQTDWRAQAEHGGYYQAIAAGLYRKAGIECDLRPGQAQPQHQPAPAGRPGRHGHVEQLRGLHLRAREAPFYTIAAIFQKDPQVLIGIPAPADSFESSRAAPC
jgi:NitT/TauT family transport system substrate-binding protein